ncbi:hypothetical protein HDU83_006991 [Entophlyctis luteolus]|nr:hypothetical protein HDU83_006991 [Entophlyctis luteolus]
MHKIVEIVHVLNKRDHDRLLYRKSFIFVIYYYYCMHDRIFMCSNLGGYAGAPYPADGAPLLAVDGDHQVAAAAGVPVLAQPDALPGAQRKPAARDRDGHGRAHQAGLDVRGHVVGAFVRVHVGGLFGDQAIPAGWVV